MKYMFALHRMSNILQLNRIMINFTSIEISNDLSVNLKNMNFFNLFNQHFFADELIQNITIHFGNTLR